MTTHGRSPSMTVFTATYNRSQTLPRVYASLKAQTFRDFEWLIVDDGSTDQTAELVESWREVAAFPIRYLYQANGGKHTAWNLGIAHARGRYFCSLDSDDACTPDALATFSEVWSGIEREGRLEQFSGVCALVMDDRSDLVGDRFPDDVFDCSADALRFVHRVGGEKWGCMRTEVARRFPFPEVDGLRYVPESVVWGRIASRYLERHVNRVLRIYHDDGTARLSAPSWQDARAFALGTQVALEEQARRWFRHDPIFFLKAAANYSRNSWLVSATLDDQRRALRGGVAQALWLTMLPVGRALYLRDRARITRTRRTARAR